jgi:hypothetical protein
MRRLDEAKGKGETLRRERDTPIHPKPTPLMPATQKMHKSISFRSAHNSKFKEDIRMWDATRAVAREEKNQKRSARSPPATELFVDEDIEENPVGGLSMSCTATLGTCGTGNLRCVPSGLDMMSVMLGPM